jgi:hypothetical protein
MFWVFKLSFVIDILAFFWLGNFLGYSLKNLAIFFLIVWSLSYWIGLKCVQLHWKPNCTKQDIKIIFMISMGLYHPLDGITNLKHKFCVS